MAYTVDILNTKNVEEYGLLSKIQIGGNTYEIKDLIARGAINTLSAGLDEIAEDLAGLQYVAYTGVYADDAAIKQAIEDGDKAVKDYVDGKVAAINKFDVHVLADGEDLPTASAETMYILYLKPELDAASGTFVEYITIKNGEDYVWEAIGSTKMDVTGFVTQESLDKILIGYATQASVQAINTNLSGQIMQKEDKANLKALAYKDSASGTVAGQTISGVKATGKSTGSISVELEETSIPGSGTAEYTPTGTVHGGKVTAAGTVSVQFTQTSKDATLSRGDYIPEGSVSVVPTSGTVKAVGQVGTAASFVEGNFTPASLDYAEVTANYATEGLVGAVDGETLTFSLAGIQALSASKVNSFTGGSKAADTFTPNVPTSSTDANVVVGIGSASFEGTKAENLKVTGVSYMCHDSATATFTGTEVDVNGAGFTGDTKHINVTTGIKSYSVKTANFVPDDIELSVGDITVAEKNVTVTVS